jgi:hypothetical protein
MVIVRVWDLTELYPSQVDLKSAIVDLWNNLKTKRKA